MDVIFGVESAERGLKVEVDDTDVDSLRKHLEEIFSGGGAEQILWITDKHGRTLGIPVAKLTYVEFGPDKGRHVGFATG